MSVSKSISFLSLTSGAGEARELATVSAGIVGRSAQLGKNRCWRTDMNRLLCALHVQDEENMASHVCSLFFYGVVEFRTSILARAVTLHM